MTTFRVRAPARLHLGMLDPSGGSRQRYGGLGVAVERPAVVIEATAAEAITAEGADADRAAAFARRCQVALGLTTGAHLRVHAAIPAHVGLGSGTKLALAVAQALALLDGRPQRPHELARAAGRGERSSVGLWTFAAGGLVVEGGQVREHEPPPLLARHPMPEHWRCVLVTPANDEGLSGARETTAFARLAAAAPPSPAIAQLVLTSLLPALVEADLDEFGAAMTQIQRLVGEAFRSVQGDCFNPRSAPLVDAMLELGAAGAGQSSWGPTAYAVVGTEAAGHALAGAIRDRLGDDDIEIDVVGFDNAPARTESLCTCSSA